MSELDPEATTNLAENMNPPALEVDNALIEPPLVLAETSDLQSGEVNTIPETTKSFTFKHENGEIHTADARRIKKLCKGMSALSLEHIEVLAEMSQRGQQIRDEKKQENNEVKSQPKQADTAEPMPEKKLRFPNPEELAALMTIQNRKLQESLLTTIDLQPPTVEKEQPLLTEKPTPLHTKEIIVKIPPKSSSVPEKTVHSLHKTEPAIEATLPVPKPLTAVPTQSITEGIGKTSPVVEPEPVEDLTKPNIYYAKPIETIVLKPDVSIPKHFEPAVIATAPEATHYEPIILDSFEPRVTTADTDITEPTFIPPADLEEFIHIDPESIELKLELENPIEIEELMTESIAGREFVTSMPEAVQNELLEFESDAQPEEILAVKSLVIALETAAEQLQKLETMEYAEPEKIAEAEALIIELYEQLLISIGIEDKDERQVLTQQFLNNLRKNYKAKIIPKEELRLVEDDEGTHEHKRFIAITQTLSDLGYKLSHSALGKFTVSKAVSV
jgi:hypothetical protein